MENENVSIAWPDVPRLAFAAGTAGDLNANVAWVQARTRDMYGYVEGYRRAALALFEYAEASRASPDYMLFPIAFAWRHYIEIALKDIIAAGRELAGEGWGFPNGHNLIGLWNAARPHIAELGDASAPELEIVQDNLREFDRIDRAGDGFRYPLNSSQSGPSLQAPPATVSLRHLHEAMDAVATFFSCVRQELSSRRDYANELETMYRAQHR
jgi:hypothetical protein